MSGIVGMFHPDGAPVDRPLLCALAESMAYRGPDGCSVWCAEAIGFGHSLLRTTWEPRQEKQPVSLEEWLWLTSDARLDERDELIAQLHRSGIEADGSWPDSELILRSYDRWGANCVDYLHGDFSFAIWDAGTKTLFCARDHFGVKPFYYFESADLFLFANTLDCVRAHPEVSAELNDSAIADFLLFGLNCDEKTTSFRDVQRLPPAHCLTVSSHRVELRRYWTPPTNGHIRYRRDAEYVEHFENLLAAAVKDRLRTDRVGILLSGGLDSTAVAAVSHELSSQNGAIPEIHTYTAFYQSLIPDREIDYAADAARFLGVAHRGISMDHLRPFAWPDDPSCRFPEPPDNPFFGALFNQFHAVAEDCRVLFSGEGNDNLMYFQMWPYVQDLKRSKRWNTLLKAGLHYLSVRPFPWRGIYARLNRMFGQETGGDPFPQWLAPEFVQRLSLKDRWSEFGRLRMPVTPHPLRPKAHASLLLPNWTRLFESENSGVTRAPVDIRYPFLDLRLVEYLLALPPFPWFFQKTLLRKAMTGKLPERVRIRPKTPFHGDPLLAHFQRDDINWVNQASQAAELHGYINRGTLPKLHGNMLSEQVILSSRPHCLNSWLQSVRSPARSTLRVETW